MGRLDPDHILQHFSHPHTLKLVNFSSLIVTNELTCAACKLLAYGWMYTCSSCNYHLHKACSKMPQTKKHQVDPQHALTLFARPLYSQGAFKCNACGDHGKGFCYHCKECKLDLHILCAHMPSSVKTNSHDHALRLCFSPPYRKKAFQCDICKGSGSNHWLYRCENCNFDAHLNCAVANILSNQKQKQQQQPDQLVRSLSVPTSHMINPAIHHYASSSSAVTPQQQFWSPSMNTAGNMVPAVGFSSSRSLPADQMSCYYMPGPPVLISPQQYVQPPRTNNIMDGNNLMELVMKGVVDGMAQQAGQIILGSILGGFSFT